MMAFYLPLISAFLGIALFQGLHWVGGAYAFRTSTWIAGWGYAALLRFVIGYFLRTAGVWNVYLESGLWLFVLALIGVFRKSRVSGFASSPIQKFLEESRAIPPAIIYPLLLIAALYFLVILCGDTAPAVLPPDYDGIDNWIPMYRELASSHGFPVRMDFLYQELAQVSRISLTAPYSWFGALGVKFFNTTTLIILSLGFFEWAKLLLPTAPDGVRAWSFFLAFVNPALMQSATVTYNDVFFLALLLALGCEIWDEPQRLFWVGLLAALAGGAKSIGYFQTGIIAFVLLIVRNLQKGKLWYLGAELGLLGLLLGSIFIQLPGWILTGNPVYPMLSGTFPTPYVTEVNQRFLVSLSHLSKLFHQPMGFFRDFLIGIPGSTVDWPAHDYKTSPLLIGLPVFGIWESERSGLRRAYWFFGAGLLYCLWQITNLDNRYLYPAYLFLIPLAALGISSLFEGITPALKVVIRTLSIGVLAFVLLQTYFQHRASVLRLRDRESEDIFQKRYALAGSVSEALRKNKLFGAPKLLVGMEHVELFGPKTYVDELTLLATGFLSVEKLMSGSIEMVERFKQLGIRHVVVGPTEFERERVLSVIALLKMRAKLIYSDDQGFLFDLTPVLYSMALPDAVNHL